MAVVLNKQKRILDAATELFTRFGFDKTSLDEIAHAAHIAKATIYYYFPSKESIFIAAIRAKAEELFSTLDAEIESASNFEEKLSCFLRLPMTYIFENMPILIEAMHQIPSETLVNLEENRVEYRMRMNAMLAGIVEYGKEQDIVEDWVDPQRFSEIINDWFLLGDSWIDAGDKDRIIKRIERDHELVVKMLMHGIIKPSRKADET
jgi:AcrR family transcriptional regulator